MPQRGLRSDIQQWNLFHNTCTKGCYALATAALSETAAIRRRMKVRQAEERQGETGDCLPGAARAPEAIASSQMEEKRMMKSVRMRRERRRVQRSTVGLLDAKSGAWRLWREIKTATEKHLYSQPERADRLRGP